MPDNDDMPICKCGHPRIEHNMPDLSDYDDGLIEGACFNQDDGPNEFDECVSFEPKAEEVGTADPNAAAIESAIERGALSPAARDMPLDDVLEQYMHYAGLTSTEAAARALGVTQTPVAEETPLERATRERREAHYREKFEAAYPGLLGAYASRKLALGDDQHLD